MSQLSDLASQSGFKWSISPANSPWRQGSSEVRIKCLKRLLQISVGSSRLSPTELQTVLFEAANLSNERPIGVIKTPSADGNFHVLTPNSLLLGRSKNSVPDDTELSLQLKRSDRYQLVQTITSDFWNRWVQQVTPEKIIRQKWHESGRNVKLGDVVLLHDKSPIKGKYQLGLVETVKESDDKLVRSCSVSYVLPSAKDPAKAYSGGRRIVVSRSIQRLSVILPVEEQSTKVNVVGDKVVEVCDIEGPGAEDSWSQKKERIDGDNTDRFNNEDLVAEERTDSQS